MSAATIRASMIAGAVVALAAGTTKLALGSTQLEQVGSLANNEGIVVDVATFKIVRGTASEDTAARIAALNAKQVAEGAIVFRSGDKLYIVDAHPGGPPQAMRANWPPRTIDDFNSVQITYALKSMARRPGMGG